MSFGQTIESFFDPVRRCLFAGMVSAIAASSVLADTSDDDRDDYDPLPGRTAEQIEALIFNFDEVVETVILYTALVALLVILLTLAVSMRLKRWAAYVVLTLISLAWFAFYEQHATGLYWIGLDVPINLLVLIGAPLMSAHFFFAGWNTISGSSLSFARPILLLAALTPWIFLWVSWLEAGDAIPPSFAILAMLASCSHLLAIPSFAAVPVASVYTTRNVLAVVAALVLTGLVVFGELDEGLDASFAIRTVFVAVVCLFAFFLVQFVIAVLRERDASIRRALTAAQREAEQTRALLEAEQKYTRAKEAAQMHTRRLATASHDIRQPIASLRSTMAAVAKGQSQEIQTQLKAAFDYLDQLAKSYMETEDAPNAPEKSTESQDDGREVVSAQVLTDTLDRMFRKEALSKGLDFDVQVKDDQLNVAPLVLTRILSNLLSNAIKHTETGHVSLSAEPVETGYQFAVANSGTLPAEIATKDLFTYGVRGEGSDGSGYGLNIVAKLSETQGLKLDWSSNADTGTEFRILIPAEETSSTA